MLLERLSWSLHIPTSNHCRKSGWASWTIFTQSGAKWVRVMGEPPKKDVTDQGLDSESARKVKRMFSWSSNVIKWVLSASFARTQWWPWAIKVRLMLYVKRFVILQQKHSKAIILSWLRRVMSVMLGSKKKIETLIGNRAITDQWIINQFHNSSRSGCEKFVFSSTQ